MSFDEGIAMPIANEENKQLEAEVCYDNVPSLWLKHGPLTDARLFSC